MWSWQFPSTAAPVIVLFTVPDAFTSPTELEEEARLHFSSYNGPNVLFA